jgi:hypothetical protein
VEHKENQDILRGTKTNPILNKILKYETNWIQHIDSLHGNRLLKLLQNDKLHASRNKTPEWINEDGTELTL